ncbi:Bug family tripartite tricarboxylate transporter substrate binding protein [Pelagibacterium limicola]|uniref:Bug family tripartite tricarboxylate transporter substrate binding protein n=1 Tax=Pelagibacterium limicola TaxID=2791022 RepID=UPI0018AF7441|nr:tripartite tricarboxylate transporter substrate-binding protein [Pelagibacterium limicola]
MKTIIAATLVVLAAGGAGVAQDFPNRPVTLIVPYGPGGSTDLLGRQLANELQEKWGQPVVVENRPGAGSMIGTASLAQAEPDGHTILINTAAFSTAPAVQTDLPFDAKADISPIAMIATSPYVVVGGAQVESETFAEFLAEAQARPMFFATAGVGSSSHFAAELLIQQAGIPGDVVHFSGGGEANTNLMGGHADIYISTTASVMPYVNNNQLKALGVLGEERFVLLPDFESSGENGVRGIDVDGWIGLFGPGGMSDELLDRINSDVNEVIWSEAFQGILQENFVIEGRTSAPQFKAQVEAEMDLWVRLADERGITGD